MNFSVQETAGAARTGVLSLPKRGVELQTPATLMLTRRGLPIFLMPDVMEKLRPGMDALQICTLHFLESPPYTTVAAVGGGVHEFVGMRDYAIFATARDSLLGTPNIPASTALGAWFDTPGGRRQVAPDKYAAVVNALQPDVCAALADEVPASASAKRTRLSVDRTLTWLDSCLKLCNVPSGALLGVVVGGGSVAERARSARETALRDVAEGAAS